MTFKHTVFHLRKQFFPLLAVSYGDNFIVNAVSVHNYIIHRQLHTLTLQVFGHLILVVNVLTATTGIVRLHGTVEGNQHSIIEDLPTASLLQTPGARADATTWCDESGHVWLFGGEGYDDDKSAAQPQFLNDLWLFNTSRLEWNVMYSRTTQSVFSANNSKSSCESHFCQNITRAAPDPRKTAASCGVPGIVFVVFGGINSRGISLSDTWVYIIRKARWLPLTRNVTKSVHPPAGWSTQSSWCHLDSFFVIGSSMNSVTEIWKLSLRTLEWTNESLYLIKQDLCSYNTLPFIQPAVTNAISTVWNGTFYSYYWQIVHSDSNSQMLSVDLLRWQLLPYINLMNEWHRTPFLWSDLNSVDKDNAICSASSVFQQSSDDIYNGQSCKLHKCYKITSSISLPEQRLHTSSWFYEGNMYIFGGQSVVNNAVVFFNHLCILQLLDIENTASYSLYLLLLSLLSALVVCIIIVFAVFCFLRYHDYRRGRKKSRQLQVRYTLLRDEALYE